MVFRQATVFTGSEFIANASVRVANGRIAEITADTLPDAEGIDLAGDYLVPGFVDVQVYGGSEQFLNAAPSANTVRHILASHQRVGTTSIVPTIFSAPHSNLLQAAEAVRTVMKEHPFGVLGLHVEGPYINTEKRGVHNLNYVRQPNLDELTELFTQYADTLLILTVAPECFTTDQWAALLTHKPDRLRLSVGHSNATYVEATQAFDNGASLATHLYNAMRGFESREPGVVGAVFDHSIVRSSIVADGFHCDPVAIRLAHRLLGDRLFLISDALLVNPTQGTFELDAGTIVHYDKGRLLNRDNKLAGSAITLLDAIHVCVHKAKISLVDTLRMASTIPAELAGYGDILGKVQTDYVANLVRLDKQLQLNGVWLEGKRLE